MTAARPLATRPLEAATSPRWPDALDILRRRRLAPPDEIRAAGFPHLEALVEAVAHRLRMPRARLAELPISTAATALLRRADAERHGLLVVAATPAEVTVATADPARFELFDWLGRELRRAVVVVLAPRTEIDAATEKAYGALERGVAAAEAARDASPSAAEIERAAAFVDRLLARAIEHGASDVHVEPTASGTVVRVRVDGVLRAATVRATDSHASIVSRLKVLAQLDIAQRHAPQDGRFAIGSVDVRLSVMPVVHGEKACLRLLDTQRGVPPLSELGFEREELARFLRMIRRPHGLVLVTGPTGSGKTTTLHAALRELPCDELNVVTIEDPVEHQLPGVSHIQVNPRRGLSFANALRSILRQDPDVIMVGEIRDRDTGALASEAALTGHLVLSSLHTGDAAEAVTRLGEMGVEPFALAPALVGVVAQRLLRRVCTACRELYVPDAAEVAALGLPSLPEATAFARGRGCARCHGSGYAGRVAVREVLETTEVVRRLVLDRAPPAAIREAAGTAGFRPMRHAALRRLFSGVTSSAELLRVVGG